MPAHRLRLYCPAKINLGLEVLERDPVSGYHHISTILQAVDLYDRLELELPDPASLPAGLASGSQPPLLELSGPFAAETPAEGNSVLAAWALMNGSQCFPPLRLRLNKAIPSAAGLGGGSSDAAGMLLAMRELARLLSSDARQLGADRVLWPLAPDNRLSQARRLELLAEAAARSDSELLLLAARIGSDVPFFLGPPCALAQGFGELLTPLRRKLNFSVLLIVPPFRSATGPAYQALERDDRPRQAQQAPVCAAVLEGRAPGPDGLEALADCLGNDFETLLLPRYPQYLDYFTVLQSAGAAAVGLSGSGSACYGLFSDNAAAVQALEDLRASGAELRLSCVSRPLAG